MSTISSPLARSGLSTATPAAYPDGLETYILKGNRKSTPILKRLVWTYLIDTRDNRTDGIKVIERFFDVPLDYSKPDGETIRVFARNMIPLKKLKSTEKEHDLPYSDSERLKP